MSEIANILIVYSIWIQSFSVTAQIPENTFGLDIKNPIVYQLHEGNERSHFGWSVTLVQTESGPHGKAYW